MGYGPLKTPSTAGSNCKTVLLLSVPSLNRMRTEIRFLSLHTEQKKEVPVLKLLSIITSDTYVQLPPALELNIGLTLHPDPNTFRDFEKQSL